MSYPPRFYDNQDSTAVSSPLYAFIHLSTNPSYFLNACQSSEEQKKSCQEVNKWLKGRIGKKSQDK